MTIGSTLESLAMESGLPLAVLDAIGIEKLKEAAGYDRWAAGIIIETLKERYDKAGLDGIRADRIGLRDSLEHLIAML